MATSTISVPSCLPHFHATRFAATLVFGDRLNRLNNIRLLLQILLVLLLLLTGKLLAGRESGVVLDRMATLLQDLHKVLSRTDLGQAICDLLYGIGPSPLTFGGLHAFVDDGNLDAGSLLCDAQPCGRRSGRIV